MKYLLLIIIPSIVSQGFSESTVMESDELEKSSNLLNDGLACNPEQFEGMPLKIIISKSKDTLNVFRNNKQVYGYPIEIRESGFPKVTNVKPTHLLRAYQPKKGLGSSYNIFIKRKFLIRAWNSPRYKMLSPSRKALRRKIIKKRRSGLVNVETGKMERLWNCANKMGRKNLRVTVKD